MASESESEQVARIVALINQAQSDRIEAELKPYNDFFEGLADKLDNVLSTFSSGSIKCSVSRYGLEAVNPETFPPHGKPFRSLKGDLRIFLRADRSLDNLLCEICFGGAGTEQPGVEEGTRPASRIEQFLRALTFDALRDGVPQIVSDLADISLTEAADEPVRKKPGAGPAPDLKSVCVTLLVNAFSLSADLEVLIPLSDLEPIFGAASRGVTAERRNMSDVLSDCRFDLVASLPPQEIGLDNILGLEVGSILKLKATPSHPSLLHVEGVEVGRAHLNISADQIAVSLI